MADRRSQRIVIVRFTFALLMMQVGIVNSSCWFMLGWVDHHIDDDGGMRTSWRFSTFVNE
jgi:hypothetical protein